MVVIICVVSLAIRPWDDHCRATASSMNACELYRIIHLYVGNNKVMIDVYRSQISKLCQYLSRNGGIG